MTRLLINFFYWNYEDYNSKRWRNSLDLDLLIQIWSIFLGRKTTSCTESNALFLLSWSNTKTFQLIVLKILTQRNKDATQRILSRNPNKLGSQYYETNVSWENLSRSFPSVQVIKMPRAHTRKYAHTPCKLTRVVARMGAILNQKCMGTTHREIILTHITLLTIPTS